MPDLKDWVAGYAAVLSTLTAGIQLTNAVRDRSRIRLRCWKDSNDKPGADRKHLIVSVANTGRRTLSIYPPQVELAQHNARVSRIYWHSPNEIAEGYNWYPLDESALDDDAFELAETSYRTYRFELGATDRILAIRVADRIGDVRYRHRFFLSPIHRVVFFIRHSVGSAAKARVRKASPN